jgi:hypothetical protein
MGEAVEGTGTQENKKEATRHGTNEYSGGLYGGIFIDEAFEAMCKARLGRRWDRLSRAGIKEIMKGEWEHAIKPQFRLNNNGKEYIVGIPAEAFGKANLDDDSRQPFIKKGRIHFSRLVPHEVTSMRKTTDLIHLVHTFSRRSYPLSVASII